MLVHDSLYLLFSNNHLFLNGLRSIRSVPLVEILTNRFDKRVSKELLMCSLEVGES